MDYRVRSGDTMTSIAAKFGVSLGALEAANPQITNPNLIFVNELVHVPGTAVPTSHPASVSATVVTYVVRPGDTMSAIAAAHNISLATLEAANPQVTNPDVISPGEVLNLIGGHSPRQAAGSPQPPAISSAAAIPVGDVTYAAYNGGGDIDAWISRACQIIGVPPANWLLGYRTLCYRESSYRANAVNDWDINAHGPIQSDGYPLNCSRGVAQCIPETFASNHIAKTSTDIYDPVANIAASMHYVMTCYGVSPDGSNLAAQVQQADPRRGPCGY